MTAALPATAPQRLPLTALVPSLTNPRKHFDPEALQELADSIRQLDVGQPILVRPLPASRLQETFADSRPGERPTHEIVAGERRYRAARMAGLTSVPVYVRELTDDQVLHMQIVENLQRRDLHPLEEAEGYRRILDLPGDADKPMKDRVAALSKEINKSPRYIYVTLQLLNLCEFAREIFMRPNVLPRSVALQIATIGNDAGQTEATKRICGLVRQGKEWVQGDAGMTQREAAQYVRDNFRLVLSKAPFPIKVVYAGVHACTECDKNTDNASHLVDEGAKVPATCTDPSCYGKKTAEHAKQIAEAARQAGQKVITGNEAKKIAPWEDSPEHLSGGEYTPLSERLYSEVDYQHSGKTVQQLLGKDMPKPVLIERADGKGFIEAIATKELHRLLKERNLHRKAGGGVAKSDDQKQREAKAKREKEYRALVVTQLLEAVTKVKDQDALRSQLLLPMALQLHRDLDKDATKKLHRLLEWERLGEWPKREKLIEHFRSLDGTQFNRFLVGAIVARELQVSTYASSYKAERIEEMCDTLKVDAKAIKTQLDAERKAAEKAKAAKKKPATKKAIAKTADAPANKTAAAPAKKAATKKVRGPNAAFMAPLYPSEQLAAVIGGSAMPRTEIVSKLWMYIKKHKLNDTANKRMVNCDEKLQAVFGKKQVSMFEMAGLVGKHLSNKAPTGSAAAAPATAKKSATQSSEPKEEHADTIPVPGDTVRIKTGLKGPGGKLRKCCGKTGRIASRIMGGDTDDWMVAIDGGDTVRLTRNEFVLTIEPFKPAGAPLDPASAWPFSTTSKSGASAKASTKKPAAKKGKAGKEIGQGELELDNGTKLKPQPAWPFPTARKPDALGAEA